MVERLDWDMLSVCTCMDMSRMSYEDDRVRLDGKLCEQHTGHNWDILGTQIQFAIMSKRLSQSFLGTQYLDKNSFNRQNRQNRQNGQNRHNRQNRHTTQNNSIATPSRLHTSLVTLYRYRYSYSSSRTMTKHERQKIKTMKSR